MCLLRTTFVTRKEISMNPNVPFLVYVPPPTTMTVTVEWSEVRHNLMLVVRRDRGQQVSFTIVPFSNLCSFYREG